MSRGLPVKWWQPFQPDTRWLACPGGKDTGSAETAFRSGHVASAEPPVHRWLQVVMQALWESIFQSSNAGMGGLLRIVGTEFQLHFI